MKTEKRYCCGKCGSSDIEVRAWVKPYKNNEFSAYYNQSLAETECCYCCRCAAWVRLVEHEVDAEPSNTLRCGKCGSTEVSRYAYVYVNRNNEFNAEMNEAVPEIYHCAACRNESDVYTESEMTAICDKWAENHFSKDEWSSKSPDEKIAIYIDKYKRGLIE